MSRLKKGQKSPAEIENLIKFTYSSEASLTPLQFKPVNTTFQKSLLWHTKHFPPGEQSDSEKREYISNRNEIISSICEVAVKSQSKDEISVPVECSELAELAVSRCERLN